MLNIISLTANRKKVTWPGKVVKNLIKWLDIIGYPYVLNSDLNATKRLWIHDDFFALRKLHTIKEETKLILGPNLYSLPRAIPENIHIVKYPHIMPSQWVVDFWKYFWYTWILDSWPAGIDTDEFVPSGEEKTKVIIYFKQRKEEELVAVINVLEKKSIEYEVMRYGNYDESFFQETLKKAKYVIWIGCSESQGIAFEEILASNIPILLWDIDNLGQCSFPENSFTKEELEYKGVTAAPYFDHSCGVRISSLDELEESVWQIESSYTNFNPRKYVEENLSLARQAKEFIKLFDAHYNLSLADWYKETLLATKKFRNNFLIEKLFDVYDSSFWITVRKLLKR